jgi:cytochrome c oxidase subunit 2
MQMKIIVDTPEDYKIWLKEQTKLAEQVKAANAPADEDGPVGDSLKAKDTMSVAKIAMK